MLSGMRRAAALFGVLAVVLVLVGANPHPIANGARDDRPRLVVLVVFDQFRGDYLERWNDLYEPDGFKRLQKEGAEFSNCHYPFAGTWTAAGHASMACGCPPAKHGIVANDVFDRKAGAGISIAASDRYQRVPLATVPEGAKSPPSGSPERMRCPNVADALKSATDGKARVVALSMKDRGAVFVAGKKPDACYWFDAGLGGFATSTYYRDAVHRWVADFNRAKPADRWFGKDWNYLRPKVDYRKHSGPDDVEAESTGIEQGRTFPHPMTGGLDEPGEAYYRALCQSPMGNELLLQFAGTAIDKERLGADDVPDLLCLSFSCNDQIGHAWGPDSHEVLDCTLRSDLLVRELLQLLDQKVGKGRYLLVLSSDHGVCPLPEVSQASGKDAKRLGTEVLGAQANDLLSKEFDRPGEATTWIEASGNFWIYLNQRAIHNRGLESAKVEETLAGWLRKQDGVQAVYTRSQLAKPLPPDDELGEMVRKSFDSDWLGEVHVVQKPLYLFSGSLVGTTHGTPHPYDTHVPLLVFGPGVKPGARKQRVTPLAVAAILAHGLGIDPPRDASDKLPAGLFED